MADVDAKVLAAAGRSPIAAYRWKNRGKAPAGYVKGMALAFAGLYRQLKADDPIAQAIAIPPTGDASKDVLEWYAGALALAGVQAATPAERLIQVFTILLGLGMRESSGKHCEGRDMSADNGSADAAEAGVFQVSYDSLKAHPAPSPPLVSLPRLALRFTPDCTSRPFDPHVSAPPRRLT
jgi:hypothetical protein